MQQKMISRVAVYHIQGVTVKVRAKKLARDLREGVLVGYFFKNGPIHHPVYFYPLRAITNMEDIYRMPNTFH